MADLTKELIVEALQMVRVGDDRSIVEMGLVSEVVIANGKVYFSLEAGDFDPKLLEAVARDAEKVVADLPGVHSVGVTVTAERQAPAKGQAEASEKSTAIAGVKHIVAVASGKGGVGKSTTSVNLALGLKALGLRVGILDADVFGPSMPRLLGVSEEPQLGPNGEILPLEAYGVKVMSMGFMVAEGTPVVWRGPMVMSALGQMLQKVAWAPLDVLVIDMPPGTGDVQLTIAQQVSLTGAVIVSTPQDLALIDARKGVNMFGQVNVPILGIVENMSYFVCPSCGTRSELFGHGGAREEALKIGVDFLGEVPLNMIIRETSDEGRPIVATEPTAVEAQAYLHIAENIRRIVVGKEGGDGVSAPEIIFE